MNSGLTPTRSDAEISDIRRVVTIIKGGVSYDAAALYQALGVMPAN